MKIASKEYVIKTMSELMLTPKKKFSQNFLTDEETVSKIVDSLDLKEDDLVIEIGPGLGALTEELLLRGSRVDAYEVDLDMVNHLKKRFKSETNLNIFYEDFLKTDLNKYKNQPIKFISDVPYNLTTPIIEKIVTSSLKVINFVFMVQKEVYERIKAKVGSKDYSPLNIYIEYVGKLTKVMNVPARNFIPAPNVDSVVLKIEFTNKINEDEKYNSILFKVIKASFLYRRKTILNNLIAYLHNKDLVKKILLKANLEENLRPDNMTLEQYLKLTEEIINEGLDYKNK